MKNAFCAILLLVTIQSCYLHFEDINHSFKNMVTHFLQGRLKRQFIDVIFQLHS